MSSAEVRGLHESLARLPSPFEVPVARKEEPDDADKALFIHDQLDPAPSSDIEKERCDKVHMRSEGPCKLAEASGTFGWE